MRTVFFALLLIGLANATVAESCEGEPTEDGGLKIACSYTKEELDALEQEAAALDQLYGQDETASEDEPASALGWNPFKRKTKYCVTCTAMSGSGPKSEPETIRAYGFLHSKLVALSVCGGPFSLQKGSC